MQSIDILQNLPQDYPFIFIDRILDIEKGKRVVCLKNITVNEDFSRNHL